MKILVIFLIHVIYFHSGLAKEKTYPILQGDLFSSLQKRLDSLKEGLKDGTGGDVDDQCIHRTNHSTIIKTNQSIADKAVFLKFHKGKEKENCVQSCCETPGCNLAVYEQKDEHNCYLFDCGTREHYRCHFAHHEGYIAMTFQAGSHSSKTPSTQREQDKHEDELEGLETKGAAKPAIFTTTTTTTSTAAPTTTTTTRKPTTTTPKSVVLYGDCSDGGRCDDENAVCRGGVCICQSGYHAKYGKCRQNCGQYQLECENKGLLVRGPNCIALSMACDGTPQCADGSDELGCQPTGKWEQQQSSGRDGAREGSQRVDPAQYNSYREPERHDTNPSSDTEGGHEPPVGGTAEDMAHPQQDTQSDEEQTGDEPKPHPQNTATQAPRVPSPQMDTSSKTSQGKGRQSLPNQPKKSPQGSAASEGNSDKGIASSPARATDFRDPSKPETSQTYRPSGHGGSKQPVKDRQDGTKPESPAQQDFVHRTDGRPPLGQHSTPVRTATSRTGSEANQGRQPSKPHTNTYNYPPYNNPQRLPPGYRYPVQYPTYDWGDYGGEDLGPGYPDQIDYPNPDAVDGGGYDYTYRHPYLGQGGYDAHPYRPHPKYQHKPVNAEKHHRPNQESKPNLGSDDMSKSGKHSDHRLEESNMHKTQQPKTPRPRTSPPLVSTKAAAATTTIVTPTVTSAIGSTTIIKQALSKPNATIVKGWSISHETIQEAVTYFEDSAQGPIVALALGLAFTVILLVFVGCRLRTVKRRIRKGRALHSNEADYLINGMYL